MNVNDKAKDLVELSDEQAWIELSHLHKRMELNQWYELCDEYATLRAEKNSLNKQ